MADLIKGTIDNSGKHRKNLSSQFVDGKGLNVSQETTKVFDFYDANKISQGAKPEGLKQLEHRLYSLVRKQISYFEKCIHPHWIQAIKDYTLSSFDRKVALCKKNKSFMTNEKQPIIRTYVDRIVGTVLRSRLSNKVYPATRSSNDNVKHVQNAIERCYSSSDLREAIIDAGFDATLLGPGFWENGFRAPSAEIDSDVDDTIEAGDAVEIKEPGAYARRIDPFCIYGDPTVGFYDQPITYRDFYSLENARLRYKDYFELNEEQIKWIIGNPKPVSTKNHKRVRMIKYEEFSGMEKLISTGLYKMGDLYEVKLNNQTIEVVEYNDGPNIVVMFNGYIVYDGLTKSPTGKHRYKYINYTNIPGTWISDSVATILAGGQRLYDAMYNIMFDLAKFSSGPMFLAPQGVQISNIDGNGNLIRDPFKVVTINGPQGSSLQTREMPAPNNVNFKMMADVMDMSNHVISPSSYNQVPTQSRSATDAELRQASLTDPVLSLSESIGRAIIRTNEEFLLLMKKDMPDKFVVGFFRDPSMQTESAEQVKRVFKTINKEKLSGNFIFESEYEAVKNINKTIEREAFNEFMGLAARMPEDSTLRRVIFNMEALAMHANELYSNEGNFVLDDAEYKKKVKRGIEIQNELKESFQELQQENGQQQTQGGGGQQQLPPQQGGGQTITPEQLLSQSI